LLGFGAEEVWMLFASLRVVLESPEVEHVDGEAQRRLLRCNEGLK
jgi:hypothetical protein